jgi:7-cyano-7-deazaguanine reductase
MDAKNRGLTLLGKKVRTPTKKLEAFPNRHPGRDYQVVMETSEFTALCPITGQPDFGSIAISYVPDKLVVESKSLKLYLWSFRQEGHFHEEVVNIILDDLVQAVKPRRMQVRGDFLARGGITISVIAEYPHSKHSKR